MRWTWDPNKNAANRRKHGGIDFETAIRAFDDPFRLEDLDEYAFESRCRTIGMVGGFLIFVVHTLPKPDDGSESETGRIISARVATRRERLRYEERRY